MEATTFPRSRSRYANPCNTDMPKKEPSSEPKDLIEERTLEGMVVVRIGRGHYRCHSQSRPETAYDVDLMHYGGLGSCTCDDFVRRRKPRWRDVRKPYNIFRCKHLQRVRNHVLDQIIEHEMMKEKLAKNIATMQRMQGTNRNHHQ